MSTSGPFSHYLPILAWLPRASGRGLGRDLMAGLTAGAVVIPQALAYATLAGLPVQYGLYVCFVPMLAYAAFGTSRVLSVSTTSTISILTATAVAGVAAAGPGDYAAATATLAVVTGAVLLAAGFLRLGVLADFISLPVLSGFKVGTGLVIAASQLGKVLGVELTGENFFGKVWSALSQLDDTSRATVVLATVTLVGLLALRRFAPRVPGPLLGVAFGILAVRAFDLVDDGVAVVPPVPAGAPGLDLPDASLVLDLLPAAAGIALMCFVESIAAARAYASRDDVPPLDADQELRALGVANLAGGLFQAYPAGGGLSQTTVNAQSARGRSWRELPPPCSLCSPCSFSPRCSATSPRRRSARSCSSRWQGSSTRPRFGGSWPFGAGTACWRWRRSPGFSSSECSTESSWRSSSRSAR